MRKACLFLAGLGLCFTLIPAIGHASLLAPAPQISEQGAQATDKEAMKTFTGVVLKQGDLFILSDKAAKTNYQLDDPKKVSEYEGKSVKVTGTLDAENLTIHVETITVIT